MKVMRIWIFVLCCAVLGWHCGVPQPPEETGTETTQTESSQDASPRDSTSPLETPAQDKAPADQTTPPDAQPDNAQTPDTTVTPDRPAPRDDATPDSAPSDRSLPEQTQDQNPTEPIVTPDRNVPEQPADTPDTPVSPIVAKAVSLQASFLNKNLQSGLMDRGTATGQWSLTLGVAKGTHTFGFVMDNQGSPLGVVSLASGTWPIKGALQPTAAGMSINFPETTRYRFIVDLQTRSWRTEQEPVPTQVSIEGSWSGKTAQSLALTKQSDGTFEATVALKQGAMSWSFAVTTAGTPSKRTLGVKYVSHNAFPQGGELQEAGQACNTKIPLDGTYRIVYRPLSQTYRLEAAPADSLTAFQQVLQNVQNEPDNGKKATLLRQFLTERKLWYKMPMVQNTQVLFLLEWKAQAPVHVAGTFNQWSTQQNPMKQVSGTDFFYLSTTLPTGHHEYKYVDSSTSQQWITDPNNPAFVYAGFGPNSVVQVGQANKSQLHFYSKFAATQLANTRDIVVYLPPDYNHNTTARYPVLYMHDGQNLFDPNAFFGGWDVGGWMDKLIGDGTLRPTIIVGAANTPGRMDEYTHTQDRISGQLLGGKATQYADFLIRDLKPFIDGLYRTRAERRATGTMGSSLGGLISLWLGFTYPDVFYRIGALSSTFGWGKIGANNDTLLDLMQPMSWRNFVVYIDSGSPNDNYQETLQMRTLLEQKGYLHDLNLRHWTEQGASHNETEWRKRLYRPLTFLSAWE